MSLDQFLLSQIFAALLVFCRIGSAIMLFPGFGEAYVLMRARLFLALMLSIILAPVLTLPPPPTTVFATVTLILAEIMVGLFIGGLARMMISAVHMAGVMIAMQSNLASALVQDVTQVQGQASAMGNFLSMAALVLLFSTNLHHMMLQGIMDSYELFMPGLFPPVDDFAELAMRGMNEAAVMSVKLAAPHIIVSILLNLAAGVMARLVPTIQVFFIITAPQLLLSFFILMVVFNAMMLSYLNYFQTGFAGIVSP